MDTFKKTGAYTIYNLFGLSGLMMLAVVLGFLLAKNMLIGGALIGLLIACCMIYKIYKIPRLGIILLFFISFFAIGSARILPGGIPVGLSMDFVLALTWIIIFFKGFKDADWSAKNNLLTTCMTVWMGYCLLQLFNPETSSYLAWFYAVRGVALYAFMTVPLLFLIFNKIEDFKYFINFWFIVSILAGLYGAKQYFFGVFGFEQAWLNAGGHVTHVLWGKFTRMFSFMSDANQFGTSQAHAATVALVFAITEPNRKMKIFYGLTSAVCFYGMIISGTRGAIVVPIIGLAVYIILSKNFKIMITGAVSGAIVLYLLAFTLIMHKYAPVRRMRTVFNATQDASFNVRIANRMILKNYLRDKPFGGGIGSAGYWGNRFSPGTFLANFETDGQYVRVNAETGIVGLYLYCGLYILIIGKMIFICWRLKNKKLQYQMIGLTVGLIGMMAANYSDSTTMTLPSCVNVLCSMAFVFMAPVWDKNKEYPTFGSPPDSEK